MLRRKAWCGHHSKVIQTWLAVAVLCAGTASGAAPSYSADSIVNASNGTPGPFAPNSVMSIYGKGLARSPHALAGSDLVNGGYVPTEMNYVHVYVQNRPVPLLYVSPDQINFIMSSVEPAGPVTVRVANEGNTGPEVTVTLVDAAPALFPNPFAAGYIIAQAANYNLLTADAPAHPGDVVVIYATGLGLTEPNPAMGEIPNYEAPMRALASLKVTLNGMAVDPSRIEYAGVTPQAAGLYQINLVLPDGIGIDPEIQVTMGNETAPTGLKLPVR